MAGQKAQLCPKGGSGMLEQRRGQFVTPPGDLLKPDGDANGEIVGAPTIVPCVGSFRRVACNPVLDQFREQRIVDRSEILHEVKVVVSARVLPSPDAAVGRHGSGRPKRRSTQGR